MASNAKHHGLEDHGAVVDLVQERLQVSQFPGMMVMNRMDTGLGMSTDPTDSCRDSKQGRRGNQRLSGGVSSANRSYLFPGVSHGGPTFPMFRSE